MVAMVAILDFRSEKFLAIFDLQVILMLLSNQVSSQLAFGFRKRSKK